MNALMQSRDFSAREIEMLDKFNPVIKFPSILKEWKHKIEETAADEKLTYFPIVFEMVDYDTLYQIAARGGFPQRYPHWSFGQEYDTYIKQHKFAVMKISEMIINTDPCYAYLMTSNQVIDQKMVMAHAYGHADFFKNNLWFLKTDRKMIGTCATHGKIVEKYIDQYGENVVEEFLDTCFSIQSLIDRHSLFIERKTKDESANIIEKEKDPKNEYDDILRFDVDPTDSYMDTFVNDPKSIKAEKEHADNLKNEEESRDHDLPEKDILLFLIKRAPLKPWQRHILSIIRNEAYYFAPQGMTKIMNEGWASYWHSHILTKKGICENSELIDYAIHHSGTMGSSRTLNPYKLGMEIFLDIEERWNKGQYGKDWDACDDLDEKGNWDTKEGRGREKMFEVSRLYNDVEFIDEFFTRDLAQKLKLYNWEKLHDLYYIKDREFENIKKNMLFGLSHSGIPNVSAIDADYQGNGTLLLKHHTDSDYIFEKKDAKRVIENIQRIWNKPVELHLTNANKKYIYKNSGASTAINTVGSEPTPQKRIYETYY